jgi:hypothetical protein
MLLLPKARLIILLTASHLFLHHYLTGQRILHLEGAVRAKDREVDKMQRGAEAARAAEAEVGGLEFTQCS